MSSRVRQTDMGTKLWDENVRKTFQRKKNFGSAKSGMCWDLWIGIISDW